MRQCPECGVEISGKGRRRCPPCALAVKKELNKIRCDRWYAENKEYANAQARQYQKDNFPRMSMYWKGWHDAKREGTVTDLLNRDGYECDWCGRTLHNPYDGKETHIDHIIPVSEGRDDRLENLQLLHMKCNHEKFNYPMR